MEMENERVFETTNLDLGAYLMLHDVKYMGCRIGHDEVRGKPLAIMQFLDDKQNARDLERLFMTSSEKRHRDLTKYLLKEVHRSVNRYMERIVRDDEEGD